MKKIIVCLALSLLCLTSALATDVVFEEATTGQLGATSNNKNSHTYSRWDADVDSALVETETGYARIEYISGFEILVELYDDQFQLTATGSVPVELETYIGFYEGADHYYFYFTAVNPEEDDSVEVARVVKYDKDWNRVGETNISAINTVRRDIKSCAMAEVDGKLLIHTAHTMYASSDGNNHQANLRLVVDIDSMELLEQASHVWNTSGGYVSHSFSQMIDVSADGQVVTADHGDAYPRSLAVFLWSDSSIVSPNPSMVELFPFEGSTGYNTTGGKMGGMEIGSESIILAGTSVTQDENFASNSDYNIFVATVDKDGKDDPEVTWFTNYDGTITTGNPYLVEVDEDNFVLLWNEYEGYFNSETATLCWTVLDGSGTQVGDIHSTIAPLSDVEPIVNSQGNLVWFTTNQDAPVFYTLSLEESTLTELPEIIDETYLEGASDWAVEELREAKSADILDDEVEDITDNYTGNITREQFCRLVMNLCDSMGAPRLDVYTSSFTDTTNLDVIHANALGIVNGISTTEFNPEATITREAVATMLKRAVGLFQSTELNLSEISFGDADEISDWAVDSVAYANTIGVLNGDGVNVYPQDSMTCQEAVLVVVRTLSFLQAEEG